MYTSLGDWRDFKVDIACDSKQHHFANLSSCNLCDQSFFVFCFFHFSQFQNGK